MKTVRLMLGGNTTNIPDLTMLHGKTWIGADHGNLVLLEQNIVPQISVGDFDSLTPLEKNLMELQVNDIRYANAIKDYTDSQLALDIALTDLKAQQILIYGATGGRLDHELVNLLLPLDLSSESDIGRLKIIDRQNVISYFTPGRYTLTKIADMDYLAFVNLVPVNNFTIQGAKYPLKSTNLARPISFASNEFVGYAPVDFAFTDGVMAVIQSRG
ncbi:thiamine diphosphokinase [Bombilactobacillus thymidiniphilus]|uniref:Thiamine diphosphokinase n=1 Tax=Bombilactobacillus thymidiniphilus TaxID=2923363 RepID=A0ABY4PCH5_9LACO|nr:thiamine diphosphokinase [Bombilactobacillus thymidiniphilus]UQS83463.1 thiamine diphosphokinase [Bombilactobacillus thymidiniphilus]